MRQSAGKSRETRPDRRWRVGPRQICFLEDRAGFRPPHRSARHVPPLVACFRDRLRHRPRGERFVRGDHRIGDPGRILPSHPRSAGGDGRRLPWGRVDRCRGNPRPRTYRYLCQPDGKSPTACRGCPDWPAGWGAGWRPVRDCRGRRRLHAALRRISGGRRRPAQAGSARARRSDAAWIDRPGGRHGRGHAAVRWHERTASRGLHRRRPRPQRHRCD